jgi:hypothetical protein
MKVYYLPPKEFKRSAYFKKKIKNGLFKANTKIEKILLKYFRNNHHRN